MGAIVKDWRDRVHTLVPRKESTRSERIRRAFVPPKDTIMVMATVLSAIATAFTGWVALNQSEYARLSLTQAERSAALAEFIGSANALCRLLPDVDPDRFDEIDPKSGRTNFNEFYGRNALRLRGLLWPAIADYQAKSAIINVWLERDDVDFDVDHFVFQFSFFMLARSGDEKVMIEPFQKLWRQAFIAAQENCKDAPKRIALWFLHGDRPMWDTPATIRTRE